EGDLGEQLGRNGLARSYGFKTAPPGLTSSRIEVEKLQQFENEARQDKIGAWGMNDGRLNARARTPSAFSSFVPEVKSRPRSPRANSSAIASPIPQPSASITPTGPGEKNGSHAKEQIPR